jgi:hypothetical protein
MADKVQSLLLLGIDAAELEAQARMPPQFLVDLRKVYAGDPPQSAIQTAMKKMMDEQFPEFVKLLHKSEMEWRAQVAALDAPGRKGKEELLDDEGLERAMGACREWLKQKAKQDGRASQIGRRSG